MHTPFAFHACNNKEDILTQSQMFKADDRTAFIESQRDEIAGLQKFDVMKVEHISQLKVASWSTIRLLLLLLTLMNLKKHNK
jgi:hypothetical protein